MLGHPKHLTVWESLDYTIMGAPAYVRVHRNNRFFSPVLYTYRFFANNLFPVLRIWRARLYSPLGDRHLFYYTNIVACAKRSVDWLSTRRPSVKIEANSTIDGRSVRSHRTFKTYGWSQRSEMEYSVHFLNTCFFFCLFRADIDECETLPDLCANGRCINTLGSYRCSCNKAYKVDHTGTHCNGKPFVLRHWTNSDGTLGLWICRETDGDGWQAVISHF